MYTVSFASRVLLLPVAVALLICCSSSLISALTVDLTRLTALGGVTYPEDNNDNNQLMFHGVISAGKTLNISSITLPRTPLRVVINVTMDHLSVLTLRNITFPHGLHVFIRLSSANSDVSLRLDNCNVTCSASSTSSSSSSSSFCPNTTAGPSSASSGVGGDNNGTFAFLLEVPPFAEPSVKNAVGTMSLDVVDSFFRIADDGRFLLKQSLVAFAVQHQQHYRFRYDQASSLGLGYPPTALVHSTRMPFVSVTLRSSRVVCDSDGGPPLLHSGSIPDLVSCISLGTGDRADFNYGWEQKRAAKRDLASYAGVIWPASLVFLNIDLQNLTVNASCSSANCSGVAVSGALFKRVRFVDSTVSILQCAVDCSAFAILNSYGDNFTDPDLVKAALTTSTSTTARANSTKNNGSSDDDPQSDSNVFVFDTTFPIATDPSATIIIVARNQFTLTQTPAKFLSLESAATAIVLRAADIKYIRIYANRAVLHTRYAHPRFLLVPYLTRGDELSVSHGNAVTVTAESGHYENAVFQWRVMFVVKRILVQDFNVSVVLSRDINQAAIGSHFIEHFDFIVLRRLRFSADCSATQHDTGLWIMRTMRNGGVVHISDVVQQTKAGKNHVVVYWHGSLIERVREFVLERITAEFTNGTAANILFLNGSLVDVNLVRLSQFNLTASLSASGAVFVSTGLIAGPKSFILENGVISAVCGNGAVLQGFVFAAANNYHKLVRSRVVVRNVRATITASLIAAGVFVTLANTRSSEYGAEPVKDSVAKLEPAQPIYIADSIITLRGAAPIRTLLMAHNLAVEALVLRGVTINAPLLFHPLVGIGLSGRAELTGIDASALFKPNSSPSSSSSSSSSFPVSSQPICSLLELTPLVGKKKIRELARKTTFFNVNSPPAISWVRARHCGESSSISLSTSATLVGRMRGQSRSPTYQHKTNTTSRSRSWSQSRSQPPPPLDLEPPAATNGMSATAAIAGMMGGAGATLALDAARAMAVMTLVQRCNSYRETDQGLPTEQRRKKYHDAYLHSKLSFPQNVFPFICVGPPRGACIRGATVSNAVFLVLAAVGSFFFGAKTLSRLLPNMSPVQRQHASCWTYSRAPFFLGLALCFVLGEWITQIVVMLAVPDLPDSDAILAVVSMLIIVGFVAAALYIVYPRVVVFVATEAQLMETAKRNTALQLEDSDDEEEYRILSDDVLSNSSGGGGGGGRRSSSGARAKKKKFELSEAGKDRAVGSIWRCEESFTMFGIDDPHLQDKAYFAQQQRLRQKAVRESAQPRRHSFSSSTAKQGRNLPPSKKRMTVAMLMAMPPDVTESDFTMPTSDGDGEYQQQQQQREMTPRSGSHRRSSAAAAAESDADDHHHNDISTTTPRMGRSSSPLLDTLQFLRGRSASAASSSFLASPLSPNSGGGRRRSSTLSNNNSNGSRSASGKRDKKKTQQQPMQPQKTMADVILDSQPVDDSVLLKPATRLHHLIWSATKFTPSLMGRLLFLGHHVWLDDPAMEELRKARGMHTATAEGAVGRTEESRRAVVAGGYVGGWLWSFGSLVNKHVGPYTVDVPLVPSGRRTKQQREAEKDILCEKVDFAGTTVRRYHHRTLRLRLAPFYTFVSVFWTLAACLAQGVALVDPEKCSHAATALFVINVCAFVADCFLRPFIVHSRNWLVIFAGLMLSGGTAIAAFVDPRDTEIHEVGITLVIIFIVTLLCVGCFSISLKAVLHFGKGTIVIRREILRRLETVLAKNRKLEVGAGGKFLIRDVTAAEREAASSSPWRSEQRANHGSLADVWNV